MANNIIEQFGHSTLKGAEKMAKVTKGLLIGGQGGKGADFLEQVGAVSAVVVSAIALVKAGRDFGSAIKNVGSGNYSAAGKDLLISGGSLVAAAVLPSVAVVCVAAAGVCALATAAAYGVGKAAVGVGKLTGGLFPGKAPPAPPMEAQITLMPEDIVAPEQKQPSRSVSRLGMVVAAGPEAIVVDFGNGKAEKVNGTFDIAPGDRVSVFQGKGTVKVTKAAEITPQLGQSL